MSLRCRYGILAYVALQPRTRAMRILTGPQPSRCSCTFARLARDEFDLEHDVFAATVEAVKH
jgi:hypothetical protein